MTERPQNESQEALGALMDLGIEAQRTEMFYLCEGDEIYAPYETASIFVNEIIAHAEPSFTAGNLIAVRAAMIELGLWMEQIDSLHIDADVEVDETRPEVRALKEAMARTAEAALRYKEAVSTPTKPGEEELLMIWRAVTAPSAYAAILHKHLEEMRLAGDDDERAGAHNRAARNAFLHMGVLIIRLTEAAKAKTGGPRPSRRQAQRCLYGAREAMIEYEQARELFKATRPIRRHTSITRDEHTDRSVQEIVATMKEEGSDFIISANVDEPGRSLVVYLDDEAYTVKHASDEYPEGFDWMLAQAHAVRLMQFAEHAEEHDPGAEDRINQWSGDMVNNAVADLHHVDREAFSEMIQLLREADPNPLTIREAAKEALIHGNSGADLLLRLSPEREDRPTDKQAAHVIKAARDTGIDPARMRAICAVLGSTPEEMHMERPTVSTEQLIEILDACPVELHAHQVMTIAKILGTDQWDEDLHDWMEEWCEDLQTDDGDEHEGHDLADHHHF